MITRTFYIFYPSASSALADMEQHLSKGYYVLTEQRRLPSHYRVVLIFMLSDQRSLIYSGKPDKKWDGEGARILVGEPDPSEKAAFVARARELVCTESLQQPPVVSMTRPLKTQERRVKPDAIQRVDNTSPTTSHTPPPLDYDPPPVAEIGEDPFGMLPDLSKPDRSQDTIPDAGWILDPEKSKEIFGEKAPVAKDASMSTRELFPDAELDDLLGADPFSELDEPSGISDQGSAGGELLLLGNQPPSAEENDSAEPDEIELDAESDLVELTPSPTDTEEDEKSLAYRIKEMTVIEKRKLAMKGGRGARNILIRDQNKSIHMFVLKNPRLTLDEVRAIARMTTLSMDVYKFIAEKKEWNRFPALLFDLTKNPVVPIRLALKLVPALQQNHLRYLARGGARMPVVQAARSRLFGKK